MNRMTIAIGATAALGVALVATPASAQSCDDATMFPNRVVITGSTAIRPLVRRIGAILAGATNTERVSVIYSTTLGSCSGVLALNGSGSSGPTALTGTAEVYNGLDPNALPSTIPTCTMPAGGLAADLALSDVFATECAGAVTTGLRDTLTMVLPFEFIMPSLNTDETGIDAREAYQIYGFGAASANVSPWTMDSLIFQRSASSGTQITISRAIHVPEGRFQTPAANGLASGSLMLSSVAGAMTNPALGFAGTDTTNPVRGTRVHGLAYRHYGQNNFYYPDSTAASFDKVNVRDGHYPVWGYEHALVRLDAGGAPLSASAQHVADLLVGSAALPGTNEITRVVTTSYLVPLCAMQVSRTSDGGDFSAAATTAPCNNLFECTYPGHTAACTTCTDNTACGGGTCRRGVCESR